MLFGNGSARCGLANQRQSWGERSKATEKLVRAKQGEGNAMISEVLEGNGEALG
ncbi:hypothetical protein [Paratractidigestivibacter sp.]|uniref:hypothetical protein n=1 Tax=Paratractidigestivibacter sp. TaxID=2847316 RepID=UPI002ACB0CC4|nr:hypothetical protein [Paratractidigestivibacter sp.]